MGFPIAFLEVVQQWFLSWYRFGRRVTNYGFHRRASSCFFSSSGATHHTQVYPCLRKCSRERGGGRSIVCDIKGTLLRSTSPFPFFMLVAFEGGGILRALTLLLSHPILLLLNQERLGLKVMTFITFCGLRTGDVDLVARAVLPKFYLEDLNLHTYEVLASAGRRVVVTCMPRIMVEGFLKDYLNVELVVGTELHVTSGGCYFSGLVDQSTHDAFVAVDAFRGTKPDVAIARSSDNFLLPLSKEGYVVDEEEARASLPRDRYPKPLVFHDGRLAFLPTPLASLFLFLWLPVGFVVAVIRMATGVLTPLSFLAPLTAATGVSLRVDGLRHARPQPTGVLFVCTHRTLLDPLILSTVLRRPVTAVTYSLSRVSELLAPIRTVRLTRDRTTDGDTMARLLGEGDLVVCPEGTTCREPYLLRFSPLFAELTDEIVPVAVDVRVSMFYGTTASGYKWLDPLFLLMNPSPKYSVRFLPKVESELTCGGGGRKSCDVANIVQRDLAAALGFQCTSLSRKDKYLMLAGNDGIVGNNRTFCG